MARELRNDLRELQRNVARMPWYAGRAGTDSLAGATLGLIVWARAPRPQSTGYA
ncbi:MAG: hypothetical protein R3E84_22270 [Pseudomonadales bacterium]